MKEFPSQIVIRVTAETYSAIKSIEARDRADFLRAAINDALTARREQAKPKGKKGAGKT